MDRIKENESENTTVRALVVNVTYKVSISDAQIPQDVLDGLKKCSITQYHFLIRRN